MTTLAIWQEALINSWTQVLASFLGVLPKFFGAVLIFAIGLIIAYWAKKVFVGLLKVFKFEKVSKGLKLEQYLKKAEIKLSLTDLLGTIVEWIVVLVFFLAVVDILGLTVVSGVLLSVLGYVPNVIAAVLIFAAGYIVANVVDGLVRGALASVDHKVAKPLGKFARWLILLIAFFAAVDQLKIAQGLINTFFQGLTYTMVLAIGLSVGLGAKDLVSKVLNNWYEKIKK